MNRPDRPSWVAFFSPCRADGAGARHRPVDPGDSLRAQGPSAENRGALLFVRGELALPRLRAGKGVPASEAQPLYVRHRVALTTAERDAGMRL